VLSSAPPHANELLKACAQLSEVSPGTAAFIEQIALLASKRDLRAGLGKLFDSNLPMLGKFAAAAGWLEVMDRQHVSVPQPVTALLPQARRLASDPNSPEPLRLAAVKLLGRSPEDAKVLAPLLDAQHLPSIQKAALAAVAKSEQIDVAELLVQGWRTLSPALRSEALSVLFSRRERIGKVLDGLESGVIPPGEITVAQQNQLLKNADPDTRKRVERIFTAREKNRAALLETYSGVKDLKGDARKGATLFEQQCATCHRLKGQGTDLGPDLGMVANKSPEALLTAILDPNRAVESRYISYNLSAKNGDEYSGVITSESANSLALRSAGGVEKVLLRSDIARISSSGISLMPEGLETALPPQEMANLIAYILSE